MFRKNKLIRELRAEIQRLRELLSRVLGERDAFREIAAKAIEVAREKHFPPAVDGYLQRRTPSDPSVSDLVRNELRGQLGLPDYIPPLVKNCPECCVSVRADDWPQECPSCHCVFGFEEGQV